MKKQILLSLITNIQKQDALNSTISNSLQILNSGYTVLELDKYSRLSIYQLL